MHPSCPLIKSNFFILTGRERLLQLFSLLRVKHAKCVQVLGATDLELDNILALLDFHRTCIFPSCSEKEIFNLVDLLRLCIGTDNRNN